MIIDIHHHFSYKISEKSWPWLWSLADDVAKRVGKTIDKSSFIQHATETWEDLSGDRLIKWMDESGVDLTCLFSVDSGAELEEMRNANRLVGKVAERYPDRVVALAGLDPRRPEAADMLKQCFEEFGTRGLKYHPDFGFSPVSAESYKLLEIVQENRGILMTHTGALPPPSRPKFVEPRLLSDLAVDFPDLTVIAAHMGFSDCRSWAGLAATQPNLYGDLAMWDAYAFGNYELVCRELRYLLDYTGTSKVMFGTDAPVFESIIPAKDWIQLIRDLPEKAPEGIHFTRAEVDGILGENAAAVLGIRKDD